MTKCAKTGNCVIFVPNFTKNGQLYLIVSAVESQDVTDKHAVFVTLNIYNLQLLYSRNLRMLTEFIIHNRKLK
jgi:hypothetical protein